MKVSPHLKKGRFVIQYLNDISRKEIWKVDMIGKLPNDKLP